MQDSPVFSARQWIAANLVSAERFRPETLDAVESFTLMWQVFEGLICDNSATISRLEKLSAEIVERRRCHGALDRLFSYFQNRYYTGTAFTAHFDGLRLRATDRRDFIEAVLRNEKKDRGSRISALLLILSRIHCNLFKGSRDLDDLNSQAPAINAACLALATVIEAHGRHFKRERYGVTA